ncbi:hypothetical protein AQPE_4708 [Aquipluma nitroreducens]|uniref:Uncharacterized protein n=1 Tax=Aquipluma nitroreducens TaxID=2010828 RepID=A0A5K7SGA1_9BACT|nr:hypothetical protein AQPE_4708 [Aquipluma nitroreducens]
MIFKFSAKVIKSCKEYDIEKTTLFFHKDSKNLLKLNYNHF